MLRIPHQAGLAVLTLWASCGPVAAFEASDTLASWSSASSAEKTKLVIELLKRDGRESDTPAVVKCLDAASGISGHAGLTIGRVAGQLRPRHDRRRTPAQNCDTVPSPLPDPCRLIASLA